MIDPQQPAPVSGDLQSKPASEPSRRRKSSSMLRSAVEWVSVIVIALAAALLIKEYVFQAFEIPSGSMQTTVNVDDRILVNKLSYRFGDVQRGDLVVFERLENSPGVTDQLIKRAIGLPGETVEVRADGRIWIWGAGESPEDAAQLQEPYLDPENSILEVPDPSQAATSDIWNESCVNQPRDPGRCTLGESSYFMMGDNRNASSDSRFFGPVPGDHLVGRAFLRIWPVGDLALL